MGQVTSFQRVAQVHEMVELRMVVSTTKRNSVIQETFRIKPFFQAVLVGVGKWSAKSTGEPARSTAAGPNSAAPCAAPAGLASGMGITDKRFPIFLRRLFGGDVIPPSQSSKIRSRKSFE